MKLSNVFIHIAILSMILIGVGLHSPFGIVTSTEINFWGTVVSDSNAANEKYNISNQSSVLYMDPGGAPYFFHANSSCRYISPLPLQRDNFDWSLRQYPAYWQEHDCVMNYEGKYIITVNGTWFNWTYHSDVDNKIKSEYNLVWNKSWDIYERKN